MVRRCSGYNELCQCLEEIGFELRALVAGNGERCAIMRNPVSEQGSCDCLYRDIFQRNSYWPFRKSIDNCETILEIVDFGHVHNVEINMVTAGVRDFYGLWWSAIVLLHLRALASDTFSCPF